MNFADKSILVAGAVSLPKEMMGDRHFFFWNEHHIKQATKIPNGVELCLVSRRMLRDRILKLESMAKTAGVEVKSLGDNDAIVRWYEEFLKQTQDTTEHGQKFLLVVGRGQMSDLEFDSLVGPNGSLISEDQVNEDASVLETAKAVLALRPALSGMLLNYLRALARRKRGLLYKEFEDTPHASEFIAKNFALNGGNQKASETEQIIEVPKKDDASLPLPQTLESANGEPSEPVSEKELLERQFLELGSPKEVAKLRNTNYGGLLDLCRTHGALHLLQKR